MKSITLNIYGMKKLILSFAILAASSFTMLAANDNKCPNADNCGNRKECVKKDDCKGPKADFMFNGMNLTEEQKAKIGEIRKQCKMNCENLKNDCKKDCKNLNEEQKQQFKQEMKGKMLDARKSCLAEIKKVLTPEQYIQFLENNYIFAKKGDAGHFKGEKRGFDKCKNGKFDCPRQKNGNPSMNPSKGKKSSKK